MTELATVNTEIVSYDDWAERGIGLRSELRQIEGEASRLYWDIGNWLVYGENAFPDQWSQMADDFGFSRETVRNMMWVASKIPPEEVKPELSWWHHQAVAALPQGDRAAVLETAIDDALSVKDTRLIAKSAKHEHDEEVYADIIQSPGQELKEAPPVDNPSENTILTTIVQWSESQIGQEWTQESHNKLINWLAGGG